MQQWLRCRGINLYWQLMAYARRIACWLKARRLRNKSVSILSINCLGGVVSHDYFLEFRSPTVNLRLLPEGFVCLAAHLREFLAHGQWEEAPDPAYPYPAGWLRCPAGEVYVYFQHYASFAAGTAAWNRRAARVEYDNLVLLVEAMGASPALLEAYEALPFARKVIFTDHATALPHGFHLHCYNRPEVTGGISMKYPRHSLHRWYEEFDMAAFLNDGTVQASRWGKRLRKKITTQGEHK